MLSIWGNPFAEWARGPSDELCLRAWQLSMIHQDLIELCCAWSDRQTYRRSDKILKLLGNNNAVFHHYCKTICTMMRGERMVWMCRVQRVSVFWSACWSLVMRHSMNCDSTHRPSNKAFCCHASSHTAPSWYSTHSSSAELNLFRSTSNCDLRPANCHYVKQHVIINHSRIVIVVAAVYVVRLIRAWRRQEWSASWRFVNWTLTMSSHCVDWRCRKPSRSAAHSDIMLLCSVFVFLT